MNRVRELGRQMIHAGFGLAVIAAGLLLGRTPLLLLLMCLFAVGITLINLKLLGCRIPFIDEVLNSFERRKVFPGKGALYHLAGALAAISLTTSLQFGFALVAILAVGDGLSTVVGVNWGASKLAWNKKKSVQGLLAFVVGGSAAAYPFIGAWALAYSAALGLVESIPADVDDNLLVPVAGLALRAIAAFLGVVA